jgi:hypothetical protein
VKRSVQFVLVAVVSCFVGSVTGPAIHDTAARAQAPGIVVPKRHVGHFQIDAYGFPGNRGCYVIDTVDGQMWHIESSGKPQLIGSVGRN